jgi:hypothetical protein
MKVPDSLTRERPHLAETCPEVEVAVLGPVEIRGITVGFSRASALELVVYLGMHPMGVANETWATFGECSQRRLDQ